MLFTLAAASWVQIRFLVPVETKREWGVFTFLMTLVAVVGTSLILDSSLPNPLSLVRGLIEPFGHVILH